MTMSSVSAEFRPSEPRTPRTPRLSRAATASGLAVPLVWTASWLIAGALQYNYRIDRDYVSGLAAPSARLPEVMMTGFALTGSALLVFAMGLPRATGLHSARLARWLLAGAGVGFVAAGLLQTDCSSVTTTCPAWQPGGAMTWRSEAHNIVALGAVVLVMAPPLLVSSLRLPRHLRLATGAMAVVAACLMLVFHTRWLPEWNGIVQRAALSLPLWWPFAIALYSLRFPSSDEADGADAASSHPGRDAEMHALADHERDTLL